MKKIFFAAPIFFVVAMAFVAFPAHAAFSESRSVERAASGSDNAPQSDEALILKQALDILQKVLSQLRARLDAGDRLVLADPSGISLSLASIQGKLLLIDGTLAALSVPRSVGQVALEEGSLGSAASAPTQEVLPGPIAQSGGETAALADYFAGKNLLWPGTVAVAVLALTLWVRRRSKGATVVPVRRTAMGKT